VEYVNQTNPFAEPEKKEKPKDKRDLSNSLLNNLRAGGKAQGITNGRK